MDGNEDGVMFWHRHNEVGYQVAPFRAERNATIDTLRWARKRLQIPVLLEVDITSARSRIRDYRRATGLGLSLTAWIVSCVARAVAEHPRVHAMRRGRKQLVLFDDVDIAVLAERAIGADDSETLPMPFVVRTANRKSPAQIHDEIRRAQHEEVVAGSASIEPGPPPWLQRLFFRLPAWVRDLAFWRWLLGNPQRIKATMGTVVVTSAGMGAPGVLSWGIPSSIHPLAIAVGGVARRESASGKAEFLALTVVFDHAVTDGAPVARFIHRLTELIKQGPEPEAVSETRRMADAPAVHGA